MTLVAFVPIRLEEELSTIYKTEAVYYCWATALLLPHYYSAVEMVCV